MNSCPSSGRTTPPMIFPSVDFPAPFAPTSACTEPPANSTLTSSSALVPEYRLPIEASRTGGGDAAFIRLVLDPSLVDLENWLNSGDPYEDLALERPVRLEVRMRAQVGLVDDRRVGVRVDDVHQVRHRLPGQRVVEVLDAEHRLRSRVQAEGGVDRAGLDLV